MRSLTAGRFLRSVFVLGLLALTTVLATARAEPDTHTAATASPRFTWRRWVSYYGNDQLDGLARFDVVDLDADESGGAYSPADIAALEAQLGPRGGKAVSYLNLGSCEQFRTYWPECQPFDVGKYQ